MATLKFGSLTYEVDHAVKGDDYIHGYDAHSNRIAAIENITSFDDVEYDGTFLRPEECLEEECNNVKILGEELVRPDGTPVGIGASIEAAIAVERGRIDELVAMRGEGNELEVDFEMPSDAGSDFEYNAKGTIRSNGTRVALDFYVALDLKAGESTSFDFISSQFTPFSGPIEFKAVDEDLHVVLYGALVGSTSLTLTAGSEDLYSDLIRCYVEYDLLYVNIPELSDLRVDAFGINHPTAGEAIRDQFESINKRLEDVEENGGGSGSGGAGTAQPQLLVQLTKTASSHTAAEINAAYAKNQNVVALIGDRHVALESSTNLYATFVVHYDDNNIDKYLVDDNGYVEYYADYYAYASAVGDISTALDSIIAIQNELIGGDDA